MREDGQRKLQSINTLFKRMIHAEVRENEGRGGGRNASEDKARTRMSDTSHSCETHSPFELLL